MKDFEAPPVHLPFTVCPLCNLPHTPRYYRNPKGAKATSCKNLLLAEIERGNINFEKAEALWGLFVHYHVDYEVQTNGTLAWWLITDEEFGKMIERGENPEQ
jgi:hypothetical protein